MQQQLDWKPSPHGRKKQCCAKRWELLGEGEGNSVVNAE